LCGIPIYSIESFFILGLIWASILQFGGGSGTDRFTFATFGQNLIAAAYSQQIATKQTAVASPGKPRAKAAAPAAYDREK
jgi:hypothetical protein